MKKICPQLATPRQLLEAYMQFLQAILNQQTRLVSSDCLILVHSDPIVKHLQQRSQGCHVLPPDLTLASSVVNVKTNGPTADTCTCYKPNVLEVSERERVKKIFKDIATSQETNVLEVSQKDCINQTDCIKGLLVLLHTYESVYI